jgi:hypothetical protein
MPLIAKVKLLTVKQCTTTTTTTTIAATAAAAAVITIGILMMIIHYNNNFNEKCWAVVAKLSIPPGDWDY